MNVENKQNCLNCKYEPDWTAWDGRGDYTRCYGTCRLTVKLPILPPMYRVENKSIQRFSDNSGLPTGCRVWEKKGKQNVL